jgi:NMD protein affecting ribosome stability and mRNA decay
MNWDTENFLQWYYDEECQYCGNCGYLQHADFWFEIECKEHENILEDEERDVLEKKWSPVDEQVEWLEKQYAELNEFTADKNTGTILDVMTQFQERIKQLKGE